MSPSAAICSKCGWEDHQWKATSKLQAASTPFAEEMQDASSAPAATGNRCALCGSRLDPKSAYCPSCGYLARTEFDLGMEEPVVTSEPRITTPATPPPRVESYTVSQETIGHKDKRRNYYCPRCQNKVEDPRPGKCPHCGFVGTMQYDIYQHQPQWASNQQAPAYAAPPRQQPAPPKPPKTPAFEDTSNCPGCGAPNPAESRFCRTCGHRYGTGRLSRQVRTQSTSDWSATAAAAGPRVLEPIYQGAGGGEAPAIDIRAPGARGAPPKERRGKKTQVREYGERKFPLGLLMALMVVIALIIALGIFVISKEFRGEPPSIAPADTTPPVISQVVSRALTSTSAEVTWVTDKPSTSQVMLCDPDGLCTWTDQDTTLVKTHSVRIDNIKEGITYHVTVKSVDQSGNEAIFETEQMFSGGAPGDTTPPTISDVVHKNVTDMGVLLTWKTNEPATSIVEYGTTTSYGSVKEDTKLVTNHSVSIPGLSPDTVYYYRVVSRDAAANETTYQTANTYFKTLTAVTIGLAVGNRAPDFTLKNLNDNDVTLWSFRGNKIVMINFWYSACNPCVAEMPHIQNVYTTWSGSYPLEVLAVNIMDNKTVIQAWLNNQTTQYTFPMLVDTGGTVKNRYNITSAPVTFIIDTQGIIRHVKAEMFVNQSEIETMLNTVQ